MQVYELARRSVLAQGKSISQVSRELGLDWRTVKKMTREPVPPGYRLSAGRARPVLGPYLERIEEILRQDETAPHKQRHTARRIFERLRDEFGFHGGETQVRAYVSEQRARPKEAFVPLVSVPGEAEADFKESVVEIAGIRMKAHCFMQVLPHSRVWFCSCYPKENAESFADGHARAFEFFGGVPRRCVYDNAGYSVKRGSGPIKGRERQVTDSFAELQSAYLFEADFAAPRKGNEKGCVERKIGVVRSRLFVPVPRADSWEDLNRMILEQAAAFKGGSELFAQDAACLLPMQDYQPSRLRSAKVDKLSLVRVDGCFYSVPTHLVGRSVLVRSRPFDIDILTGKESVAKHRRLEGHGRIATKLCHYLDLLELKPRAAARALPVIQAGLPVEFEAFRQRALDGTGAGDRLFVGVLRLLTEFGVEPVRQALCVAIDRGVKDPADIKLLVLRCLEEPSAHRAVAIPHGHAPVVVKRNLSEYGKLMAVAG